MCRFQPLNIAQTYSVFLEKYDESYKISKEFRLNIPSIAKSENYTITARILFANGNAMTMQKVLTLGECKTEDTEVSSIETIRIESETKPAEAKIENNNKILLLIMSAITLTLLVFIITILVIYNRKNIDVKENMEENTSLINSEIVSPKGNVKKKIVKKVMRRK